MAIAITERPLAYSYTSDSPAIPVYSNWNAVWNPIVYSFAVAQADLFSTLVINIYEVGSNTLLASTSYRPFRVGTWTIDISPYIRSYLYSAYAIDFSTADNCPDEGNRLNFYITTTQEFDNGSASIFVSEQTRPIVGICSAMQFGDANGGNMIEYVPFIEDLPVNEKLKFLTSFETPVMWSGYLFTLSYIYALEIQGIEIVKEENYQDINETLIVQEETILSPLPIGKVNYLKINEPVSQNVKFINVNLKTDGTVVDNLYVEEGYVDTGYTQIL